MRSRPLSAAKKLFLFFLFLYIYLALVPAAVYRAFPSSWVPSPSSTEGSLPASAAQETAPTPSPAPASPIPGFLENASIPGQTPVEPERFFTLHDAATGETLQVSDQNFLEADLACEMDLSSPEEALKAQAVAAYTYYCRQRENQMQITCDTERWLVYVPESSMRERWGEDYDAYKKILAQAVDQVFGQTLTYQGKTALTSYFAISPGSTEAVENVWSPDANREHPYLQAVASPGDSFSDGYLSEVSLSTEEFSEKAAAYFAGDPPDLSGPAEEWLTELEYTPSGMVKSAMLGGKAVTGSQLRTIFELRSACFQCGITEGRFLFTVRGWGHGVGMSQAGAVFMAKRGANYQEILSHYYPGTQLAQPPATSPGNA